MLAREDFRLACRALRAGLVNEDQLWELERRLEGAPAGTTLAALLVREGFASADQVAALGVPAPGAPAVARNADPLTTQVAVSVIEPGAGPMPTPCPPSGAGDATVVGAPGAGPPAGPASAAVPGAPVAPASRATTITLAEPPAAGFAPAATSAVPRSFGKYEILAELGRGGMGVVYRAREPGSGRVVALKALVGGGPPDPERVARFQREVRTAASLRHPAIVAIHDIGTADGIHYFTMDLIEGRTLETRLAEGPLPLREGLEGIRVVAEALDHAHRQNVLHRDVKPSNILLDRAGRPFLTDFGLAKELESSTRITLSGTILGTPAYMSPEQAEGEGRIDGRSDVFSLGIVLYEVLTRKRAFDAASPAALLYQTLHRDPVPVRTLNPRVHRDVETICDKAIQKEPDRRYATAGDLALDLGRFLAGEPIQARPPSLAFRGLRWGRKHRVPLAVAAVGLAALGVGAAWFRATQSDLERKMAADRAREARRRGAIETVERARRAQGDARLGLLEEALTADPDCAEACVLRGAARGRQGKFVEALEDADRAVRLRPDDAAARFLRFRLLRFGLADAALARADLEGLAGRSGDVGAPAEAARGYLAWDRGAVDAALGHFSAACARDARFSPAWTGLAWCRLARGEWTEGLAADDTAVGLDADNPELWDQRAALLLALCRYEDAADVCRAALERSPALIEPALTLAEACSLLGDRDSALAAVDQARGAALALTRLAGTVRRAPALTWNEGAALARADAAAARVQVRAGRLDAARPLLERLAAGGRALPVLEARVAHAEGRAEAERAALEQAAAAGDPGGLADWAGWLARAGRAEEAAAAFDRSLAASAAPALPGRYLALAEPCVRLVQQSYPERKSEPGKFRDAERPLLRALDANPRFAPARVRLARLRLMELDLAGARRELDAALVDNPRCVEAWLARAELRRDHRDVRDLDGAATDLAEAARLAPDAAEVRLEGGVLDLRRGRAAEALAAADAVLATRADWARARKLRADALTRLGREEEAARATEAWLAAPADDGAGRVAFALFRVYFRANRYEQARDMATRAIENDPRNADYYERRGDAYMRTANYSESFRDKARSVRLDPGRDIDLFARCLEAKASEQMIAAVAATAMTQAARRYPTDPCALFLEGLRALLTSQWDAAYRQLERVTDLDPGFASAYTFKALAALRSNRPEEAERARRRAEELVPDNRLARLLYACQLVQAGRREEAARALEPVARGGAVHARLLTELRELDPLADDPRYRALRTEK